MFNALQNNIGDSLPFVNAWTLAQICRIGGIIFRANLLLH